MSRRVVHSSVLVWLSLMLWSVMTLAADRPLQVLDIGPRTFDNAPAIAVTFSEALDPKRRYDHKLLVEGRRGVLMDSAWILSDNQRVLYFTQVEPEQPYQVWVREGLKDAQGGQLVESVQKQVTMPALEPSVGFASRGSVLPTRLGRGLPLMSVNVDAVDVDFLKVDNYRLARFLYEFQRSPSTSIYSLDAMQGKATSVLKGRFELNTPPNRRSITQLPVRDLGKLSEPGLYVAVLSKPGEYSYEYDTSYFVISDLGLHLRINQDEMDVYIQSLADALPLEGVSVQLYDNKGQPLDGAVSSAEGYVMLKRDDRARTLVARKGDDISFLSLDGPGLDLSEFDTTGRMARDTELFVYGPRDLYRPGETVEVSVLMRDADGRRVPGISTPLHGRLIRPDGRLISERLLSPRPGGYYQQSIPLSAQAQTGTWSLELRVDPATQQPDQVYPFKVEDFLPERLRLDLTQSDTPSYADAMVTLDVQGEWLWGAVAEGLLLEQEVIMDRETRPVEAGPLDALADFHFGDVSDALRYQRMSLEATQLDEQGRARVQIRPADFLPVTSPVRVTFVESLYEPGGRPVTRSASQILWPATEFVGIHPLFADDQAESDTKAEFELIRTNPQGERLPAASLRVKLIREERDYFWIHDANRGWRRDFTEHRYPVYQDELSIPKGELAKLALPVEWGSYQLEVVDDQTGLKTTYRFEAGWSGGDVAGARPDKVNLALDKPAYRAGDVVRLKVQAPHAGQALILVEGKQRLWSRRVAVDPQAEPEGTVVEIPISKDWTHHDIYLSAVVFRSVQAQQSITPSRAVGLIHLPLDRSDRKLELALHHVDKMRPEQALSVSVQLEKMAPEDSGSPVQLTLAAVDTGVLNITRFKTPEPYAWFFAKRAYGPDMNDLYGDIIETLDGPKAGLRFGGDAALDVAGRKAAAKPRIVSLFNGPVILDEQGRAEIKLPVPDFNGELRIMALGFDDQRFGHAESRVIIAAPVVAEISTPRFLAAGDKARVSLTLQNLTEEERRVDLSLSVTPPLSLTMEDQQITLAPGKTVTLPMEIGAGKAFGEGQIQLHLTAPATEKDAAIELNRQWPLAVRPAWPGERRQQRAVLQPRQAMTLEASLVDGLMGDALASRLQVSDQPPLNLEDQLSGLLDYPYGCLEQTTSRAWPLLYLQPLRGLLGDLDGISRENKPISDDQARIWVEEAISHIAGMQLYNGGFGLWGDDDEEEAWLGPYVVAFLQDAREHGYRVPASVFDKAVTRLERRLVSRGMGFNEWSEHPRHLDFAARAYAAYVLARLGKAPLRALRMLEQTRAEFARSALPLMHLSMALELSGDRKGAQRLNQQALKTPRDEDAYLGDYGSLVRDQAMTLTLLLRHKPETAGISDALLALMDQLQQRRWLSTQEQMAVLQLGLTLADKQGEQTPWQAKLGEEMLSAVGSMKRDLNPGQVAHGGKLVNESDRNLFATWRVSGYPTSAPEPVTKPVAVERTLYLGNGEVLEAQDGEMRIQAGELLLVHLTVTSEETLEHALVADLLPAGLEIENANLSDGLAVGDLRIEGMDVQSLSRQTHINHAESRDDRYVAALPLRQGNVAHLFYLARAVTPGEYTLPPVLAEDMYRPWIRGVGKQRGRLVVAPR